MAPRFAGDSPIDRRATVLADWAEAVMLAEGRTRFSRSALRARLREGSAEDVDLSIDMLLGEVASRRELAPRLYPFSDAETGMQRLPDISSDLYEFLLWLSIPDAPVRVERGFSEIDEWLDKTVLAALQAYLGPQSRGLRFGHPASDGRPSRFPDAVEWLADHLGLARGVGEASVENKDGGVDLVVWRPFRDGRAGHLVILGQVTMQLQWHDKVGDVLIRKWEGWIDFGADPITALAVPFALGADYGRWDEMRRAVTLLLDRIRLCELLEDVDVSVLGDIRTWTEIERAKLVVEA
jgi:hypothetical protein